MGTKIISIRLAKQDYQIRKIKAREILDSRGNPTVEVDVLTKTHMAREEVPSGASTGTYEAHELRDGGKRYNGKGVSKAVKNVNEILKKIKGMDLRDPKSIDQAMIELDGTDNKKKLGANAILGVSLACYRLSAVVQNKKLYSVLGGKNVIPVPFLNILNGGMHAGTELKIQEFMIAPKGKNFAESLRMGAETYHHLKNVIAEKYGKPSTAVGDEGGFAPNISKAREALDLIMKTISELGYEQKIKIAIDAAASEFYDKKKKKYFLDQNLLSSDELVDFYTALAKEYPIISIEDPFHEDDFEPFAKLSEEMKKRKIQVVGDDLLVTNVKRIKMGIEKKLCTALLLKVNQIGTVSEAIAAAKMAMNNDWHVMVSHRSGETTSSFIADLAVGLGTGQIKSGAPCRGERLAKYNRLIRIEEELGKKAKF